MTPPCSTCGLCHFNGLGNIPSCYSESYLDHKEKVSSIRYKGAEANLVRGTRFCDYIPKDGE